jgi:hypothetical protein
MKRPYAEMVAQTLIEQLEQGTAPLVKPWRAGERFMPFNPIGGRTLSRHQCAQSADGGQPIFGCAVADF